MILTNITNYGNLSINYDLSDLKLFLIFVGISIMLILVQHLGYTAQAGSYSRATIRRWHEKAIIKLNDDKIK